MMLSVFLACLAGVLVSLSRQLNGRLSLSTSPLKASFWNHIVGFCVLSVLALVLGQTLLPASAADVAWYAYWGGPVGVIFVTAGSWVITRIGAMNTALLIIGGQMVSGVILDLFRAGSSRLWLTCIGVILIMAGVLIAQRRNIERQNS